MKPLTDDELWVKLKACICHCVLKNITSMDQLFMNRAKHETYETCKNILMKHWTNDNVDPKRAFDCIEKHIFDDFDVPDSQIILGFFYIAYLMVAKNIPDLKKPPSTNIPTFVFTTSPSPPPGPSTPPKPASAAKSTKNVDPSAIDDLQLAVTKLIDQVNRIENNQKHARNKHAEISRGPEYEWNR